MITSFIGVIGSGKDYRAKQLESSGHVRVDFKDGLLDLASDIAGYDVRKDYEWFKENIVGVLRPSNPFLEGFEFTKRNELLLDNPDVMTGRRLLQRLGTEGMRKRDEDYWVKQFMATANLAISEGRQVVNADCRFMNEVRLISQFKDSRFVFCDYRSSRYEPKSSHPSERLAQSLLALGVKDGEFITSEQFEMASCPF